MREDIALDMEAGIRDDLRDCLRRCYVDEYVNTGIVAVNDEGAVLSTNGKEFTIPCDNVVLAMGTRAYCPLEEELQGIVPTVKVGDAVRARQAVQASSEGFKAGLYA